MKHGIGHTKNEPPSGVCGRPTKVFIPAHGSLQMNDVRPLFCGGVDASLTQPMEACPVQAYKRRAPGVAFRKDRASSETFMHNSYMNSSHPDHNAPASPSTASSLPGGSAPVPAAPSATVHII